MSEKELKSEIATALEKKNAVESIKDEMTARLFCREYGLDKTESSDSDPFKLIQMAARNLDKYIRALKQQAMVTC